MANEEIEYMHHVISVDKLSKFPGWNMVCISKEEHNAINESARTAGLVKQLRSQKESYSGGKHRFLKKSKTEVVDTSKIEEDKEKYFYRDSEFEIYHSDDSVFIRNKNEDKRYRLQYVNNIALVCVEDERGKKQFIHGGFDIAFLIKCLKGDVKIRYRKKDVTVREFCRTLVDEFERGKLDEDSVL